MYDGIEVVGKGMKEFEFGDYVGLDFEFGRFGIGVVLLGLI